MINRSSSFVSKGSCHTNKLAGYAENRQPLYFGTDPFSIFGPLYREAYHAIVCGNVPKEWICETPLRTKPEDEILPTQTSFERLAVTTEGFLPADPTLVLSLLKATPVTGRFHQIRRHLLEAEIPIVGDFRYAGMDRNYKLGEVLGTGTRMLLQSKVLELRHPRTGEALKIVAPKDAGISRFFPDPQDP